MSTFIEPFDYSFSQRDMSMATSVVLTTILSACVGGFYLYDMYKKQTKSDNRLTEFEVKLQEVEALEVTHTDTLEEYEHRIREKKDYDEDEEVEEGKYQAWVGIYVSPTIDLSITVSREKISTIKKNQDWIAWDGRQDGSCIVRDFYLGNSHPDFHWDLTEDNQLSGRVSETLVNGWDSVVKIYILLVSPDSKELQTFLHTENEDTNDLCNAVLKRIIDTGKLDWSRTLLSV